jgi:hypothetical protein
MQEEFTLPIYYKIFYCLLGAGLVGLSIFMIIHPNKGIPTFLIALVITAVGLLLIANGARRKVTIENDVITCIDLFNTREIAVGDVKGVRTGAKTIVIESNIAGQAPILIRNYIQLSDSFQLLSYLRDTFQDLDAANLKEEQSNLLQDLNLGFTTEERQAKLNNAKTIGLAYNIAGIVLAVLGLFLRQPMFTVLLIVYPLLSIVVIVTSKGLIKFLSDKKRSLYPFVFLGFIFPTMVTSIKAMVDFHIYSYDNFWLPFAGVVCIVAASLIATGINRSIGGGIVGQGLLMLVIAIFYAVGVIGQINCTFDKSADKIYDARIIGHHISHGRNTNYYLYLSTWGPCHQQKQISVGRNMYNHTNIGDIVKIDFKPGLLNVPWFVVKR